MFHLLAPKQPVDQGGGEIQNLNVYDRGSMAAGRGRRGRRRIAAAASGNSVRRPAGCDQHLLPGVLDDITLAEIVTRLSSETWIELGCVNRRWHEALQSQADGPARLREPFVLIDHFRNTPNGQRVLGLYCVRTHCFACLPPIPGVEGGLPKSCQCVVLNGSVYVLGGEDSSGQTESQRIIDVYAMKLAGKWKAKWTWRTCAKMISDISPFKAVALKGKIYAFGGMMGLVPGLLVSVQVYDSQLDSWSFIEGVALAIGSISKDFQVTVQQGEIFIHGGDVPFSRVYNPVSNVWRKADRFWWRNPEPEFWPFKIYNRAELERYRMGNKVVFPTLRHPALVAMNRVYDIDRNSWSHHGIHVVGSNRFSAQQTNVDSSAPINVGNDVIRLQSYYTREPFQYYICHAIKTARNPGGKHFECPFPLGSEPSMFLVHL
ncbi:unnamed protein product [Calypogeia fissa]